MFDKSTARMLRNAPAVPGLDPKSLPALLTEHYADLVSARLSSTDPVESVDANNWSLSRIADTYELITSIEENSEIRRASAFVAATAQQLLARVEANLENGEIEQNFSRNRVSPKISAALLFLAGEQYADANEASGKIKTVLEGQEFVFQILAANIRDLAKGKLTLILKRAKQWRKKDTVFSNEIENRATKILYETLLVGIEVLAAELLALEAPVETQNNFQFENSKQAFKEVLKLSSFSPAQSEFGKGSSQLLTSYSGPRHLASLLLAAYDGIKEAALINTPNPSGAKESFWIKWIRFRAEKFPFIWPNHREAVSQGFHLPGKSSVLVLPTGAGKTTLSALKIAATLSLGKKVIFLAPTHALVEQLKDDLTEMFPEEIVGGLVSTDFDALLLSDSTFQSIEVMTPESCLALLSFSPEAVSEVGLMVFDECHLLSPQSGKMRRALDSMLCVLAFASLVPNADFLFLSAMLKNAKEFSNWISSLTKRDCVSVDLLWKPSRQARAVVVYDANDISKAKKMASEEQDKLDKKAGKIAKGLREDALRQLRVKPYAIWGLQHNWISNSQLRCHITSISENAVQLSAKKTPRSINVKPNANEVASHIAINAAINNIKTIIFVNQKSHAIAIAKAIDKEIAETSDSTDEENLRWDSLEIELGGLEHSLIKKGAIAVAHNASMLRLERDISERMFRRAKGGAKVIVATPTLAQGLNLPAHLAILAGDKRSVDNESKRELLEAHEILNAAGRAGRAGHLANGIVLLIPEPLVTFKKRKAIDSQLIEKLQSILPEDDRCIEITDPLEIILDRVMAGEVIDKDVQYTFNRMRPIVGDSDTKSSNSMFNFSNSLGNYIAKMKVTKTEFDNRLKSFQSVLDTMSEQSLDLSTTILSSQSGLPPALLIKLKEKLEKHLGDLPNTITDWVSWTIEWLEQDDEARDTLLAEETSKIRGAAGLERKGQLQKGLLTKLRPGIDAWISGRSLRDVEKALGGKPHQDAQKSCPRARELVGNVIPRGLSYILGLVGHMALECKNNHDLEYLDTEVLECLKIALRRGFNSIELVKFAAANPQYLSRVEIHKAYILAN